MNQTMATPKTVLKRNLEILHKEPTPLEVEALKQWARNNYVAGNHIHPYWHPITKKECEQMNWEEKPI